MVGNLRPSISTLGPLPQPSWNDVEAAGVVARRPLSAGINSFESPTGSWTSCPDTGSEVVAYCTTGKPIVIRSVVSGGTISVNPSKPMLAYRVPSGLVILIDSGAAAKPGTGRMTMRLIGRLACQRS